MARVFVRAKVVEPLPDISAMAAPLSRRNSWNIARIGNFSKGRRFEGIVKVRRG